MRRRFQFRVAGFGALALALAACAAAPPSNETAAPPGGGKGIYKVGNPYQIDGTWYYPSEDWTYDETGIASWYGEQFHNRRTANGEVFDMDASVRDVEQRRRKVAMAVRVSPHSNGVAIRPGMPTWMRRRRTSRSNERTRHHDPQHQDRGDRRTVTLVHIYTATI